MAQETGLSPKPSSELITSAGEDFSKVTLDEIQHPEILSPREMLRQFKEVNMCAPMVRYSKVQFRQLVSEYDTHVTFTPMILAQEFSLSQRARDSDFSTHSSERGTFSMIETKQIDTSPNRHRIVKGALVAQLGGNDPFYMGHAAELLKPYVDGIDINCGCPQSWAYKEGIGSALLRKPDLVREMIRGIKARCGESFPVSIKIRIDDDLAHTSRLIKTALATDVSFITVHGRTRHQASSEPVAHPIIKFAAEEATTGIDGPVPTVANGDIFTLADAQRARELCGIRGVMSARGLQENPALFSGHERIPLSGIQRFITISAQTGFIFPLYHRHLADMLNSWFTNKEERKYFNSLSSHATVLQFLEDTYQITPGPLTPMRGIL